MQHVKLKCTEEGKGCDDGLCNLCQLFMCKVCHGAECCLTTSCPGTHITDQQAQLICAGKLDFRDGEWRRVD